MYAEEAKSAEDAEKRGIEGWSPRPGLFSSDPPPPTHPHPPNGRGKKKRPDCAEDGESGHPTEDAEKRGMGEIEDPTRRGRRVGAPSVPGNFGGLVVLVFEGLLGVVSGVEEFYGFVEEEGEGDGFLEVCVYA